MENRKSVLLADASEEFRHLFAGALAEEDDIVLIGETGDGQEAVRLAREQQPDVMVMDLVLSRMDGLEVLQALAGQVKMGPEGSPYFSRKKGAVCFRAGNVLGMLT